MVATSSEQVHVEDYIEELNMTKLRHSGADGSCPVLPAEGPEEGCTEEVTAAGTAGTARITMA